LGERVVIKVLAALSDADLLRREWDVLSALHRSQVEGAGHYATRLPAPIAHGLVDSDRARPASVFGWKSGFVHTLAEVGDRHPGGVPGEVQVWVLKRLLELLGWVHRAGFAHGGVTPDHVLVHPRDHGAMLVGWTAATPLGGRIPVISRRWAALYPGREATPALDVAMACAVCRPLSAASGPIAQVLDRGTRCDDAWALRDALVVASEAVFGPGSYHPLAMPGWT
jgi:hypothetical protein